MPCKSVIATAMVGLMSLALVSACGPAPPSEELQQLESQLRNDDVQRLRDIPNATRYFDEARQYRRVSEEAREDGEDTRSKEYAVLGLLRLQTAEAVYEKFQVAEELSAVNEEVQQVNPELRSVTQSRNELAADLRQLDQEIAQAVRDRERQRREQAQAAGEEFVAAQSARDNADEDELQEANDKIAEAQQMRDNALEFDADQYDRTKNLFQRAERQLESAQRMLRENPQAAGTARRQVEFALDLFKEAHELAQPIHEEYVEKMRPENRIASLREEARFNYTSRFVVDDANGARIVLARLFGDDEEDFSHGTGPMLDTLVTIAKEFEEFDITIHGYTRRGGGATQNLTLSQARAHNVQEFLTDAGIEANRISTEGHGQESIRFQDSEANNDRVEVVLTHSSP